MKLAAMYFKGSITFTPDVIEPPWQIVGAADEVAPEYCVYTLIGSTSEPELVGRYMCLSYAIKFAVTL